MLLPSSSTLSPGGKNPPLPALRGCHIKAQSSNHWIIAGSKFLRVMKTNRFLAWASHDPAAPTWCNGSGSRPETLGHHSQHFTTHLLHLKKEQWRKTENEADQGSRTDGNNQQWQCGLGFLFPWGKSETSEISPERAISYKYSLSSLAITSCDPSGKVSSSVFINLSVKGDFWTSSPVLLHIPCFCASRNRAAPGRV